MATKEFIAKLKETIDIVDVVSESVTLRRTGKYLTGLSPFTKEKTPSFFVNPENQSFYCYSTNQGGDVITFIELTKGLNFREAIKFLADKAGLPIDDDFKSPEQLAKDRKAEEDRKLLHKLNRYAARFYQEQLEGPAGAIARDYIAKRAISHDSVLGFALGYAPDGWTGLRDYFLKIKAPMLKAHELGLFRTKGGEPPKADGSNLFDTFRNRLMFPIRDPAGEVVGFGGRWLGASSAEAPKYLNSPESLVYEKERILYNLDQARKSIREMESVVLVEGYMDCLSLVQAGFPNVVANCGTALTRHQATMLKKLAPKVICLYDSDDAGRAASERAMNLFLEAEGFPMLEATLPDGKDPDDFLRAHGEDGMIQMAGILQNSPAALDLWIGRKIQESSRTLQARTETLDKIANKLSKLRDDLWIQARIPGVAKDLDLAPELFVEAIRKYKKSFASGTASSAPSSKVISKPEVARNLPPKKAPLFQKSKQIQGRNGKRDFGFERRFLSDLLKHPNWISALREQHTNNPNAVLPLVENPSIQRALSRLLEPLRANEVEEERVRELLDSFREEPQLRNLMAEAMMKLEDALPAKELDGALRKLREEALKRKAVGLQKRIEEAERAGDQQASESLLHELMELRRQRAQT